MSDLKRCREAFDKYVKDFPETRHDYGTFVAGWISRADVIDRQTIIDIINRYEGYLSTSTLADEILKVMRPLPDQPQPPRCIESSERKTIREWMPDLDPDAPLDCRNPSYMRSMDADATDGQEAGR